MKYQLIKKDAYKTSRWTGGETREMAIWPAGSRYLERNFVWRLSSATVEQEESDFSSLPDYDRVLMVLEGEVVLSHEGQRVARLKALEQDRFDGAYKTHSFGRITDYNLMVRKGNEGYLDLLYPAETSADCGPTQQTEKPLAVHALFCREGYFVAGLGGKTVMASPGELLVMEFGEGEKPAYTIMGEGTVIRAQVYFDAIKGQLAAEEIPSEKATFDDFKVCVYLANVQFRAAKYILPSLKRTWFDQALSKAIQKVEKLYLTAAAFLIGALAICIPMAMHAEAWQVFAALAVWSLVDIFVVSPLIYLPFMPKPVRKHIKDVNKLTPYEQKIREEELKSNPQLEKLLKKYKNSGRNLPQ
ncbi:MAG: HutD family protein [Anaerovoracaceae bacterium]